MEKLTELKIELEEIRYDIEEKKQEISCFELNPDDYEEDLDEILNENTVNVCGYEMEPAHILKTLDPIAYRQELLCYIDSMELSENEDYQNLENELEELEERKDEIEIEIQEDIESEN